MSHYSLLVVGPNIAEQLEPFQETSEGKYITFKETEEEHRRNYETKSCLCFIDPDTHVAYHFCEDRFLNPSYDPFRFNGEEKYICPVGWTEREVPVKELYTWEKYLSDYCVEEPDETTGKLGYWCNPNAKWDWYEVGGRWSNHLTLKDGTKADSARLADVDWAAMVNEKMDFWTKVYDYVRPIIESTPQPITWSEIHDETEAKIAAGEIKDGRDTWDIARERYNSQPRISALADLSRLVTTDSSPIEDDVRSYIQYGLSNIADEFHSGRAGFILAKSSAQAQTFAVLKDGKWFERGKMGWFASVHDEKDPETWTSIWNSLVRDIDPDTLITIIDCHI